MPEGACLCWFPDAAWVPGSQLADRVTWRWRLLAGEGSPIHVLMIEDDPAIADMYRLQFEHDGYQVTVVGTGEVAVSVLAGGAPDVVLLDLLLPDRSGFEVLATLNQRLPNHPPVVILSNYGEPAMIDRGRSLGAVEYLVKSRVTPADISRLIPSWVGQDRGGGQPDS
jgi:CheY-like chemotaxis protein